MKKFGAILSIFLLLSLTINTVTSVAQPQIYTQGFYTMRDFNLHENVSYNVKNHEPYAEGLLVVIDSNKKIQQIVRIHPYAFVNPLVPLRYDYNFIIYGDIRLSFS